MIRTVIVDDDWSGRERLRGLLAAEAEVEVVGECNDGCTAVVAIQELNPDLVFLDVAAPKFDALHILETVGVSRIPAVVFMASTGRYAALAFEVQAVDYVLKPFGPERLQRALSHVRRAIAQKRQAAQLSLLKTLLQEPHPPEDRYLTRLLVKEDGRLFFLSTSDVDWVEARGNVVRFHVGSKTHSLRARMNVIESCLDPEHFIRIHRSTIVNIDRVREMRPRLHGDYFVILKDAQSLSMSAGYHQKLDDLRAPQRARDDLKTVPRRSPRDTHRDH